MCSNMILSIFFLLRIAQTENRMKQIEVNGMTVKWASKSDAVDFEVFAPTNG